MVDMATPNLQKVRRSILMGGKDKPFWYNIGTQLSIVWHNSCSIFLRIQITNIMKITDIAKKLSKEFNGNQFYFNPNTYDDIKDMPYIIDDGKVEVVTWACLDENGTYLEMEFMDGEALGVLLNHPEISEDEIDKNCRAMRIYELLAELYNQYGLEKDYGEFEDFLS